MHLATLDEPHGPQAVVLDAERAIPIPGYADVGALLAAGDLGLAAAREVLASGDGGHAFAERELLRPVLAPGAVVCVGLNYRSHILEMGRELPADPTLFSKLPRALTDPFATVELPAASSKVDYEAELAVVIGRAGRDVRPEEAWDHVAGFTVMNDVTMRDFQRRTGQWFAGKTWQASTPFGPALVTLDEVGPAALPELDLRLTVNGDERQRAPLGDLVFDVPALVADLSRIVELAPGDVIATGTPGGVGVAQESFLTDGDIVEVSIDRIGTIRNRFEASA